MKYSAREGNALITLYEQSSILAALSSTTSVRTNSKQTLSDFLSLAVSTGTDYLVVQSIHSLIFYLLLHTGQGNPQAKQAVKKFGQYLSREEGHSDIGANHLQRLTKRIYVQQMPSIPTHLLSLAPSEPTASASRSSGRPAAKGLSNFV